MSLTPGALLRWYDLNRRELPWRTASGDGGDPYRVLLSEVMLQQTQVSVVLPRFGEFLSAFAGVEELAQADEDEVLQQWSGLGYYRRARALHAAAKAIVDRGSFPQTAQALRQLPGIGEYTAAAIASIAFGEVVPVLDGNVERFLCRMLMEEGNPKHRAPRVRLGAAAAKLLDPRRPGASNQAAMELGALVCTKRNPSCEVCPLSAGCAAFGKGRQREFPAVAVPRPRRQKVWQLVVEVDQDQGTVVLERRDDDVSVLPGQWLLPTKGPDPSSAKTGDLAEPLSIGAGSVCVGPIEAGRFKHSITTTDYEVVLVVQESREKSGTDPSNRRRVALADFDTAGRWQGQDPLPTSSLLHKAVKAIRRWQEGDS